MTQQHLNIHNFIHSLHSAAFDCIEHCTLISRLHRMHGFGGQVLDLIQSYLSKCSSFTKWKGSTSECNTIDIGVLQGSSLSPLLFSLYVVPLATRIQSFGMKYHQYADDTQLYIGF